MKKFLILYCAPVEAMEEAMKNASPEQQASSMKPWLDWRDRHAANMVDFGSPLGKNKRVENGEIADVRNSIGGYSIIQAESHEEATVIAKDSPNFGMKGVYTDVLPIIEMSV